MFMLQLANVISRLMLKHFNVPFTKDYGVKNHRLLLSFGLVQSGHIKKPLLYLKSERTPHDNSSCGKIDSGRESRRRDENPQYSLLERVLHDIALVEG